MAKIINVTCPVCSRNLVASCYEDPNVGIPFDFDTLEDSECVCLDNEEFEGVQLIYTTVENAYWNSFEYVYLP